MALIRRIPNLILLALIAAGCYTPESRQAVLSRTWKASEVTQIEVRGHNGRIHVEGADIPEIRMTARIRLKGSDREATPEKLIRTELANGRLRIEERGARSVVKLPFLRRDRRVDFEILVPRHLNLQARTINGRVEVGGVDGELDLKSINGRIEVSTPRGELTASTINGRIQAEFTEQFRGARLKSINGGITIEVPRDSSLDLDIRQVNGSFQTDLPVVVESSGRRSTQGSVHGGKFALEVETVNGSVRLRQAAAAVIDETPATLGEPTPNT